MIAANDDKPIILKKIFNHGIEDVFNAFATGESLEQWLSPANNIKAKTLFHQFKVGRGYKISFTLPDEQELILSGEFLEIKKPTKIIFTWLWEKPDIHAGINSLVTVELKKQKKETELTITHQKLLTTEAITRHSQGWEGTIERLQNWLNRIRS
ncbi:SRPBCC family protein [Vibrio sp. WJH972]